MANKKYAASPEALADHRERNKLYRVYGRQGSTVMDKTYDEGPAQLPSNNSHCCIVCGAERYHEDMEL